MFKTNDLYQNDVKKLLMLLQLVLLRFKLSINCTSLFFFTQFKVYLQQLQFLDLYSLVE